MCCSRLARCDWCFLVFLYLLELMSSACRVALGSSKHHRRMRTRLPTCLSTGLGLLGHIATLVAAILHNP